MSEATDQHSGAGRATPSSRSSGGRGRGRGRHRSGRGPQGGTSGAVHQAKSGKSKFKGTTEEMSGNVFECFDEQGDRRQYMKTLEALSGYVKKHMKYSEDLAPLFAATMQQPTVEVPEELEDSPSTMAEMIWMEEVKEYVKRNRVLKSNLAGIHAVIWGQCSEAMKVRIKSLDEYHMKVAENDCHWLLCQIRAITLQFDEKRNGFISLLDARTSFLNCRQATGQSADDYLEALKGWADTIEYHGGTVAENHELVPEIGPGGDVRDKSKRMEIARDRTLAIALIRGADPTRYGTLITDLANQYAMGTDKYPLDITAAYALLVTYTTPVNAPTRNTPATSTSSTTTAPEASAMTFAQQGSTVAGRNGTTHSHITCFNCNKNGHYASDCPDGSSAETTGTTLVQYGFMMAQANEHNGINQDWILLDSQSTISVIKNPAMLKNIRRSSHVLRALTNGGHQDSNMIGDFPNLGPVWYNQQSIANILSLSDVRKVCRVTMDSATENAITVHRLDGSLMKFKEHTSGLYIFDPKQEQDNSTNTISTNIADYTMLAIVAEQKRFFTRREVADADQARALYRMLGRPSENEFQAILRRNLIRTCPVTPDDAQRALVIYGPDVATIKGKMTRSNAAPRAPTFIAQQLPAPIFKHHRNVTICMDFFFVQNIPFLHTLPLPRTYGP